MEGSDSYERVCAAVVEEVSLSEEDQAFGKGGPGGILSGPFEILFRFEERLLRSSDQLGRIGSGEERLPGGVGPGREVGSTILLCVLRVRGRHSPEVDPVLALGQTEAGCMGSSNVEAGNGAITGECTGRVKGPSIHGWICVRSVSCATSTPADNTRAAQSGAVCQAILRRTLNLLSQLFRFGIAAKASIRTRTSPLGPCITHDASLFKLAHRPKRNPKRNTIPDSSRGLGGCLCRDSLSSNFKQPK